MIVTFRAKRLEIVTGVRFVVTTRSVRRKKLGAYRNWQGDRLLLLWGASYACVEACYAELYGGYGSKWVHKATGLEAVDGFCFCYC